MSSSHFTETLFKEVPEAEAKAPKSAQLSLPIKIATLAIVLFSSLAVSLLTIYFISEKYLFDKLILQKSCFHGYQNGDSWLCKGFLKDTIAWRSADVVNIFEKKQPLDPAEINIAVIGDSYVYGLGVRIDQRFGDVLERKLNTIAPTNVLSLGTPMDHVADNMSKFRYLEENYDVDAYVFTMLHNDLFFDYFGRYRDSEAVFADLKSYCVGDTYDIPDFGNNPDSFLYQLSPEYANSCIYIESMKELSKTGKSVVIFLYNVDPDDEFLRNEYQQFFESYDIDHYKDQGYYIMNRFLKLSAQEQSLRVIDVSLIDEYGWQSITEEEWHPSASAHKLFAEALFKELSTSEIYGSSN